MRGHEKSLREDSCAAAGVSFHTGQRCSAAVLQEKTREAPQPAGPADKRQHARLINRKQTPAGTKGLCAETGVATGGLLSAYPPLT